MKAVAEFMTRAMEPAEITEVPFGPEFRYKTVEQAMRCLKDCAKRWDRLILRMDVVESCVPTLSEEWG